MRAVTHLGPTDPSLFDPERQPYFLWWTDLTADDFKRRIATGTAEERAYWIAALLREANSRDVWLFVTPDEIRASWPLLVRYLGESRAMWTWLLAMPETQWPPREARGA